MLTRKEELKIMAAVVVAVIALPILLLVIIFSSRHARREREQKERTAAAQRDADERRPIAFMDIRDLQRVALHGLGDAEADAEPLRVYVVPRVAPDSGTDEDVVTTMCAQAAHALGCEHTVLVINAIRTRDPAYAVKATYRLKPFIPGEPLYLMAYRGRTDTMWSISLGDALYRVNAWPLADIGDFVYRRMAVTVGPPFGAVEPKDERHLD